MSDPSRGGPRDPVAVWFDRAQAAEADLAAARAEVGLLKEECERLVSLRDALRVFLLNERELIDRAYNRACHDCASAIESLRDKEQA